MQAGCRWRTIGGRPARAAQGETEMKKVLSSILVVAVIAFGCVLAGCEKDEVKTHRHVEVKDQMIHQDTIVE